MVLDKCQQGFQHNIFSNTPGAHQQLCSNNDNGSTLLTANPQNKYDFNWQAQERNVAACGICNCLKLNDILSHISCARFIFPTPLPQGSHYLRFSDYINLPTFWFNIWKFFLKLAIILLFLDKVPISGLFQVRKLSFNPSNRTAHHRAGYL